MTADGSINLREKDTILRGVRQGFEVERSYNAEEAETRRPRFAAEIDEATTMLKAAG